MTEAILRGYAKPVGAVLRIGRKAGPKDGTKTGTPIKNDRFFICSPEEDKLAEGITYRPEHPAFGWFNRLSEERGLTQIRGELVGGSVANCWEYGRRCQTWDGADAPEGSKRDGKLTYQHPDRRPFCSTPDYSDPEKASRLVKIGEDRAGDEWAEIECPGRKCPYAMKEQGGCKIHGRLYFLPRWTPELLEFANVEQPAIPYMKFSTGSWNTAESIEGFFREIDRMAKVAGLPGLYEWTGEAGDIPKPLPPGRSLALAGIPFILSLSRKVQPRRKRAFPVVSMTFDGEFLGALAAQRATAIQAGGEIRYLEGPTEDPEAAEVIRDADFFDVTETAGDVPQASLFGEGGR